MTKFTKGPWVRRDGGANAALICEPETDRRHSTIARVSVGNFWEADGEANAALIAAAPELYEALKEAEAEIERAEYDHGFPRDYHLYCRIRDAIAKAGAK